MHTIGCDHQLQFNSQYCNKINDNSIWMKLQYKYDHGSNSTTKFIHVSHTNFLGIIVMQAKAYILQTIEQIPDVLRLDDSIVANQCEEKSPTQESETYFIFIFLRNKSLKHWRSHDLGLNLCFYFWIGQQNLSKRENVQKVKR